MTKPLIDTARVGFQGTSQEAFEIGEANIGDIMFFSVKVVVRKYDVDDMAQEGTRRRVTLKILKVVEGVSDAVKEEDNGQGSLLDSDGTVKKTPENDETKDDAPAEKVTPIKKAKATGPQFSGGDEE
ncbi:hypothetical protein [Rhodococcoides fascians]|uniref:hypothetical protein n=1 Tax=Rhodococcoides fascians TaxID=1828 RepID=UPI0005691C1D|nr:hypothetical protein [Rhodococcus fascians]